jgi:CHAD domain-containing protein
MRAGRDGLRLHAGTMPHCQATQVTQQSRTRSDATSLSARLRERVIALQHVLDRTAAALRSKATPENIHAVRVAARRLRALLHAFRRELDSRSVKQYRRELKALTHDLEVAREAHVTRCAIAQLAKEGGASTRIEAGALHERVADEYVSALQRLRSRVAAASWRRRLSKLQRLSMRASLVPVNDEPAAIAIIRRVDRARRRLRLALRHAGKDPKRLHRLRLKVKQVRYLLENSGVKTPLAVESELKGLQRLQDCLGDMHDEENLRDSLRARRMPRRATRNIIEELECRKHGRLEEFKKCRKDLMKRWRGSER